LEHRVGSDIVFEFGSGEDHGAESAVPLIDAIWIVKEDEAP
jgi:hypothetical protein